MKESLWPIPFSCSSPRIFAWTTTPHFDAHLTDGEVADDHGNWQWVAGTGNDTRPDRAFNPSRQATRFDPEGVCVRRYVPELADLSGARVHGPWLEGDGEGVVGYPPPIADPGRL